MRYLTVGIDLAGYPHESVQSICFQMTRESAEWTAYSRTGDHHFKAIPQVDVMTEQANMRVSHTSIKGRISEGRLYTLLGALTTVASLVETVDIRKDD